MGGELELRGRLVCARRKVNWRPLYFRSVLFAILFLSRCALTVAASAVPEESAVGLSDHASSALFRGRVCSKKFAKASHFVCCSAPRSCMLCVASYSYVSPHALHCCAFVSFHRGDTGC